MSNKRNIKINDKELKLLYILGGVVLVFLVYQFVFLALTRSTNSLKSEKETLQIQVDDMQKMKASEDGYESQTTKMQDEMNTIFDSIPSNLTSEDEIIYVDNVETKYNMQITSLSMPEAQLMYTMNEDGTNVTDDGKFLYSVPVTIACTTSYDGIKDYLRNMQSESYSKSIDNISLTFDSETGDLSGTMTVNMQYLLGSDREYVPLTVDGIEIGTANIFGNTTATTSDKENDEEDAEQKTDDTGEIKE